MTSIVIAEDEAIIRLDLRELLEEEGYTVVGEAGRGDQAVELVRSLRPDLVILDVKMPGLGGLETLSAIKKSHPAVEVIMLTGHGTIESAVEGVRLGAFDYLTKPCDLEALLGKIQAAERKKRQTETQMHEARARMHTIRRGD